MNTDIKLMITLAGNQRLPHYEAEIFADFELTSYYLNTLCKDVQWARVVETRVRCAQLASYYAEYVIKGRWPEAEAVISRDSECWTWYRHFICR